MSRTFSLEQIEIAAPCPADWDQMAGDDRVRHCSHCEMNVYNLSEMSRDEAQALVAEHEGRMCVQLYERADGTVITADCPRGVAAAARRVIRKSLAVVALALVMLVAGTWALGRNRSSGPDNAATGSSAIVRFNPIQYLLELLHPTPPAPARLVKGEMACPTVPSKNPTLSGS